jgi:hypothetical protein
LCQKFGERLTPSLQGHSSKNCLRLSNLSKQAALFMALWFDVTLPGLEAFLLKRLLEQVFKVPFCDLYLGFFVN